VAAERRAGGLLSVLNHNNATIRTTNGCITSALATIEIDKPDPHTYNLTTIGASFSRT